MPSSVFPPANRPPSINTGQNLIHTFLSTSLIRAMGATKNTEIFRPVSLIGLKRTRPSSARSKAHTSCKSRERDPFDLVARESYFPFCCDIAGTLSRGCLGGFHAPSGHPVPRVYTCARLVYLIVSQFTALPPSRCTSGGRHCDAINPCSITVAP